jgi:hypothetical protein
MKDNVSFNFVKYLGKWDNMTKSQGKLYEGHCLLFFCGGGKWVSLSGIG